MKREIDNVTKLTLRKIAITAIPPDCKDGLCAGIDFLMSGKIAEANREAEEWVKNAIMAIRRASDPNPWRDASDEDIAAEILRGIEERKKTNREKPR